MAAAEVRDEVMLDIWRRDVDTGVSAGSVLRRGLAIGVGIAV